MHAVVFSRPACVTVAALEAQRLDRKEGGKEGRQLNLPEKEGTLSLGDFQIEQRRPDGKH